MKLKGVNKLNKAIERSIKENFDIELTCEFSNDFAIFLEEDKIKYSLIEANLTSETFQKFLIKHGAIIKDNIDEFIYSFLHEIGHYYTYDNINIVKKLFCIFIKKCIEKLLIIFPDNKTIYSLYYYLPDEMKASLWAINTNTETFNRMKKSIKEALFNFYNINFN